MLRDAYWDDDLYDRSEDPYIWDDDYSDIEDLLAEIEDDDDDA